MKILYYNKNLLFNNISLLRELNIIKKDVTDEYINLFKEANINHNKITTIIDRTGANPFFIPCSTFEIPKKNDIDKTFKQICKERSTELLKLGKRINIFWSGGLDSTVVLFSLMNEANDLSQLRVVLSPDSIIESGNMFDKLIKNKLNYSLRIPKPKKENFFHSIPEKNEIYVAGTAGDEIYTIMRVGNCLGKTAKDKTFLIKNYEDVLEPVLNKNVIDFYKRSIKLFPKKIKSYGDFLRFYFFNYTWNAGLYNWETELDSNYSINIYSFYNTQDFQRWGLWNKEAETYLTDKPKLPMNNFIYELTGDKFYCNNKFKGISSPLNTLTNTWMFLLENKKTITYKQLIDKKYKIGDNNEDIIL
jgi:hypothetical protein